MAQRSRLQKLKLNTLTSLALQITQVICGFVVPWLILHYYGSKVNGLVNSVTQLLALIAFLEFGVGPVLQAALYKPLSYHDNRNISLLLRCAQSFYNKIGFILIIYTIVLILAFPFITNNQFDIFYTGTLIVAIFISNISQYFFGIVNLLFLHADQRGYIVNSATIILIIANTIVGYILIKTGQSIQIVKLFSSVVFLLRPLYLSIYVKSHYSIPKDVPLVPDALKQKWSGVMQHITAIAIDFSPIVALSLFTNFRIVSVFSVYNIVLSGMRNLFFCLFAGVWPLMGELYAKEESEKLQKFACMVDWLIHTGTTVIFSITAFTIIPFVKIYTIGINDIDYCIPTFAFLFTLSVALQCYRLLYINVIRITCHFKETQYRYFISTIITVLSSIIGVFCLGINGAAIGIVVAVIDQLLWMFSYDKNNLIRALSWSMLIKQLAVDLTTFLLIFLSSEHISNNVSSYIEWVVLAFEISIISVFISLLINSIFYRSNISYIRNLFFRVSNRA